MSKESLVVHNIQCNTNVEGLQRVVRTVEGCLVQVWTAVEQLQVFVTLQPCDHHHLDQPIRVHRLAVRDSGLPPLSVQALHNTVICSTTDGAVCSQINYMDPDRTDSSSPTTFSFSSCIIL